MVRYLQRVNVPDGQLAQGYDGQLLAQREESHCARRPCVVECHRVTGTEIRDLDAEVAVHERHHLAGVRPGYSRQTLHLERAEPLAEPVVPESVEGRLTVVGHDGQMPVIRRQVDGSYRRL